jgi:hypothetical protein
MRTSDGKTDDEHLRYKEIGRDISKEILKDQE